MVRSGIFSVESLSGIYALVIDGDRERRTLISGILRYCGALVTPLETPAMALSVMALLKPDVVVVDFSPPQDAAIDFVRSIRALKPEDGGVVPAVAVGG